MTQQPTSQSPYPTNKIQQEVGRNLGQTIGQMYDSQALSVQEVREGGVFVAGNVIFQNSRAGSVQPTLYRAEREPPSLLPYLANRSEQEFELGKAFQKFMKQIPPRPLVCVIHGDEFQSHDKFLERLQKLSLPRLLGFDFNQTVVKEYPLHWPSGLKNVDELSERLCKNLADSVLGRSFASLEDINEIFCKYPAPIIIHTHLLTEDWQQQGSKILNKILEFWQNWPELTPDQNLIICLSIKYQVKRRSNSEKPGFRWLLSCWTRFFRQHGCRRTNKKINDQIKALATSDLKRFPHLSLIVLSELTNISRMHVENWVRDEATKQFVGEEMIERLIDAVREMFDSWEEKTSSSSIPMDDLADNLTHLLKSLTVTRGELA
ncbi:hypothetical protein QUA43_13135 [Microcoleus sp. N9_B4]|uniref:hypothetical protein n=1 Tax=Microcoleus sp. N9_B4 TaxID=3055386 RepID=UPI002FD511AE